MGDTFNNFLRTPDVFELRYRQGANTSFLHKFKQCFMNRMMSIIRQRELMQLMMMEHQFQWL